MQAALTIGADLVSVYCAEEAAIPIKAYSPELMVSPVYSARAVAAAPSDRHVAEMETTAAERVAAALSRAHSVVAGPGLGRSAIAARIIVKVIEESKKKHLPYVKEYISCVHIVSLKLTCLL